MNRIILTIAAAALALTMAAQAPAGEPQEPAATETQPAPEPQKEAKDKKGSKDKKDKKEEADKPLNKRSKDELAAMVTDLQMQLEGYKAREAQIAADQAAAARQRAEADSLERCASARSEGIDERVSRADALGARFVSIRLNQRYRPQWQQELVEEVIPAITTPKVLADYGDLFALVPQYPQYYQEVKDLVLSAQADSQKRQWPADSEAFKKQWIAAAKATRYYKDIYQPHKARKSKGATLFYLETQMDTFLSMLGEGRHNFKNFIEIAFPESK